MLCHFDFLGAVGHKLLDGHYGMLCSRIPRRKVRSQLRALLCQARSAGKVGPDLPALLLRLLEGEGRKHLPHPFTLPRLAFARRCERLPAQRGLRLLRPHTRVEQRMLRQAAEALADLRRLDPKARLSARQEQDQLPRDTRAADPHAPAAARLQAVAADLHSNHDELRRRFKPGSSGARAGFQPERIVLHYLDRCGDGLSGHPVARDETARAVAAAARTNNVLEQFFGAERLRATHLCASGRRGFTMRGADGGNTASPAGTAEEPEFELLQGPSHAPVTARSSSESQSPATCSAPSPSNLA